MTATKVVQLGCELFIIVTAGGSVFYFVKGALGGSSKCCRLGGGVQAVITNWPRVRRWAAWFGVVGAIHAGLTDMRQVHDPLNPAAAWAGANALFSADQGPRAAVREGLKGAAYSVLTGITGAGLMLLLQSREESSDY